MDDSGLDSLVADETSAQALAIVLARAEDGAGTVAWETVCDVIEPETWGRLLESDVLVSTGDAFVIDDPEGVRTALHEADVEVTADSPVKGAGTTEKAWRTSDKLAGATALVLVAGYQVPAIKSTIVGPLDLVLGPAAHALPFPILVLLLATATTLTSTVVRRRLVDHERIAAHKECMQRVRERLQRANARGDEATVERLTERQQDLLREQFDVWKRMLRPMVWTMLVTVPVFLWLSWFVTDPSGAIVSTTAVMPVFDRIVWTARVIGPMQVWMVWYFVSSVVSNMLAKRTLNRMYGTPGAS